MVRKHALKMKKVTIEDVDQYNELLKYVFQVTNTELSQIGWQQEDMLKEKLPVFEQADVFGWFDEKKLVSQIAIYQFEVMIFGKIYKMGGVTGVGTFPEYSNRGLMQKLIQKALQDMKDKGQTISYLYPYSIPYYRKKGWEIISDKITYEIADYQLPKYKPVGGEVVRVAPDAKEIKDAYQRFTNKTHGALIRNDLAWSEYFRWDSDDLMAAVYYGETDELDGYVIYSIVEDIFNIKDMIFMNEDARTGLWNFVSAHFSMIDKVVGCTYTDEPLAFLLEDSEIKETIAPYFMARIVDIEKFIEAYPFKPDTNKRSWIFNLDDPLLDWNQGTFKLEISKTGKGSIKKVQEEVKDSINIQTLTTMLLGYKRPEYLHKIRRINCSEEIIDMLEDAIEQQTVYFSDYF